jgi:hypothetical protein
MTPVQIVVLLVLLFSVFLGWSLWRGHTRWVRLYVIATGVPLALLGAALCHALGAPSLVEALNVAALSLSIAALPGSPAMWEEQVRADLQATRLYRPLEPKDALSWKAWLKVVDRIGALRGALAYLAIYVIALALAIATSFGTPSRVDPGFALAPFTAPGLFASLSTVWLYRAARRLIPGS